MTTIKITAEKVLTHDGRTIIYIAFEVIEIYFKYTRKCMNVICRSCAFYAKALVAIGGPGTSFPQDSGFT